MWFDKNNFTRVINIKKNNQWEIFHYFVQCINQSRTAIERNEIQQAFKFKKKSRNKVQNVKKKYF